MSLLAWAFICKTLRLPSLGTLTHKHTRFLSFTNWIAFNDKVFSIRNANDLFSLIESAISRSFFSLLFSFPLSICVSYFCFSFVALFPFIFHLKNRRENREEKNIVQNAIYIDQHWKMDFPFDTNESAEEINAQEKKSDEREMIENNGHFVGIFQLSFVSSFHFTSCVCHWKLIFVRDPFFSVVWFSMDCIDIDKCLSNFQKNKREKNRLNEWWREAKRQWKSIWISLLIFISIRFQSTETTESTDFFSLSFLILLRSFSPVLGWSSFQCFPFLHLLGLIRFHFVVCILLYLIVNYAFANRFLWLHVRN